jgi:hypothetical protein
MCQQINVVSIGIMIQFTIPTINRTFKTATAMKTTPSIRNNKVVVEVALPLKILGIKLWPQIMYSEEAVQQQWYCFQQWLSLYKRHTMVLLMIHSVLDPIYQIY